MNRNNNARVLGANSLAILLTTVSVFLLSPVVEAARWYHVEVIVFKALATELAGGEDWSVPEQTPNFATALDLNELLDAGGSVIPLAASNYYLGGVYERLGASSRYQPVLHKAWAQPGFSANNVRRVYLSTNSRSNQDISDSLDLDSSETGIEGTVGLQGGRLLHLNANFVFRDIDVTTTIAEFRRIKLKQLHYFDHPLFGVLIRVIPYKADTE